MAKREWLFFRNGSCGRRQLQRKIVHPNRPSPLTQLLALSLLLAFSLATNTAHAADKILMVLWKGETNAEIAFKAHLKELGANVEYTIINGDYKQEKLAKELHEIEDRITDFKLIYTYGTPVTQTVKALVQNRVPIVFDIVADPVGARLVKSLEVPGVNVSGAKHNLDIETEFKYFAQLIPFKKVLVLFNPREENSRLQVRRLEALAKKSDWELHIYRVAPNTDTVDRFIQDVQSGKVTTDILYVPADTFVVANIPKISKALSGTGIKIIGATESTIRTGGLLGLVTKIDNEGRMAAEIAYAILNGADARKLPVREDPNLTLVVNRNLWEKFHLKIPKDFPFQIEFVDVPK